jgi:hypothetical protein
LLFSPPLLKTGVSKFRFLSIHFTLKRLALVGFETSQDGYLYRPIVNFFNINRVSGPRSRNDGKSWYRGPSFLSWRSASSFSAIVRKLSTIQRADNKRASGRFFNANTAAVETTTTVTIRFQLAMNSTRVSVKQRKELDSDRRRLFITTAKTPGLALLRTCLNRVARVCLSSTFRC